MVALPAGRVPVGVQEPGCAPSGRNMVAGESHNTGCKSLRGLNSGIPLTRIRENHPMKNLRRHLRSALTAVPFAATVLLQAQDPASSAPPARLGSAVFAWDKLVAKPTRLGEWRHVVAQPTATLRRFECHITTLDAGQISHPPHRHPQEEFFIIKGGMLEVSINGRVQRVGPGSLLFFASNDPNNVGNAGDKPATYIVFNLTTAATHSVALPAAADSAAPDKLRSSVFDWEKLEVKPTGTGERRAIVSSPTITCTNFAAHVTTLNPGAVPHAAHRHPDEEIVVVKEGLIEATVNGVAQRGGPGSIFFFATNDEHGMKNVGATNAIYFVIRVVTDATPKPARPAQVGAAVAMKDAESDPRRPDPTRRTEK